MDCADTVYQLKIKYDDMKGKYGIVFIDSNEAALLNCYTILVLAPMTVRKKN